MPLIVINPSCIRCGLCVKACPYGVLGSDETGKPIALSDNCIRCGHCTAVCPKGALENVLTPLSSQIPVNQAMLPELDQVEHLLLTRRSIRKYKADQVPEKTLYRLLAAARYAPTGSNMQGCMFHIISRKETLRRLSALTLEWAKEEILQQTPFSSVLSPVYEIFKRTGDDVVLHEAPCLVLSLIPETMLSFALENGRFPLVYMQLFAPSLGLGSCWAGILEQCIRSGYSQVMELFNLPHGMSVSGAAVLGFPSYGHFRIPCRNPLCITWQR
jgi:nitroreductase/NAD-dependent dihydropyrimidine dehydrogenase PreA subunit